MTSRLASRFPRRAPFPKGNWMSRVVWALVLMRERCHVGAECLDIGRQPGHTLVRRRSVALVHRPLDRTGESVRRDDAVREACFHSLEPTC